MKNVIWQMENENASKSLPDRLLTRGDAGHFHAFHIGVGHFPFDLSNRLAGRVEPWIADALVVDVDQRVDEAFADRRQFAHGDRAFVELAVGDHAVNDLFDYRAYVLRRMLFERADRGFCAVGEHQDDGLFGLRLRPRVTKIVYIDVASGRLGLRLGLVIEIGQHARAVVLRDEVDDLRRQVGFGRHLNPAPHVAGDDSDAVERRDLVVRVRAALLIFDVHVRRGQLAYVVIEAGDARQQSVRTNSLGRLFNQ